MSNVVVIGGGGIINESEVVNNQTGNQNASCAHSPESSSPSIPAKPSTNVEMGSIEKSTLDRLSSPRKASDSMHPELTPKELTALKLAAKKKHEQDQLTFRPDISKRGTAAASKDLDENRFERLYFDAKKRKEALASAKNSLDDSVNFFKPAVNSSRARSGNNEYP